MNATCISNDLGLLAKNLHRFAFTQDEQGEVDLTIGNSYRVYGNKENKYGRFYLILTDSIHRNTPWWMPEGFFRTNSDTVPLSWISVTHGTKNKEKITAPTAYFGYEEDIEDGTILGLRAFAKMRETADINHLEPFPISLVLMDVFKDLNLTLKFIDKPESTSSSSGVWHQYATLENKKKTTSVKLGFVINTAVMKTCDLIEVKFENCSFIDNDPDMFVTAINSIFTGNILRDKTRFRKRNRIIILNDQKKRYMYPRAIF